MNWNTHQENICLLGMQGSGKTSLAKKILDRIPNTPRLIISPQRPQELYGQYGNPITSVDEIRQGGAFVWVGEKPNDTVFENINKKVMTLSNFLVLTDDAHEFCKKQKMPNEWARLINSGRNRGITSIFISPSPNLLNNVILQSSQHLISFKFLLESQIEYAEKNFFGDIANLLLFPPARPKQYQEYPELGKHDYLHRYVGDDFVTWKSDQGSIQIKNISDLKKTPIVNDLGPESINEDDTTPEPEPEPTPEPEQPEAEND